MYSKYKGFVLVSELLFNEKTQTGMSRDLGCMWGD